ncbi:hypothetical protein MSUIS_01650 [Mycoplasma suis KI3806]|uniref:Uncharacterized protein n=1 Tax=Mycoplasma suis (strain KI_3806) TaxID=708248 RepID=F0V336_MYCS3|nr:hypothetical protein [Mycoplasma suis]CBZ40258.1 hypothetical protein MSUIS_01650 [Mycoplasma suis KI3806]
MPIALKGFAIPAILGFTGIASAGGIGLNYVLKEEENKSDKSSREIENDLGKRDKPFTNGEKRDQGDSNIFLETTEPPVSSIPTIDQKLISDQQKEEIIDPALKEGSESFARYVYRDLEDSKPLTCETIFSENIEEKESKQDESCKKFLLDVVFGDQKEHESESLMWLRTSQDNFEKIFKKIFSSAEKKSNTLVDEEEWHIENKWSCWKNLEENSNFVIFKCLKDEKII